MWWNKPDSSLGKFGGILSCISLGLTIFSFLSILLSVHLPFAPYTLIVGSGGLIVGLGIYYSELDSKRT